MVLPSEGFREKAHMSVTLSFRRSILSAAGAWLLLCASGSIKLHAQITATILGTVTDASGAAVPTAKIGIRNVGTGATRSTTSDSQGRYRAPELQVGEYEMEAAQQGFQTVARKGITLTVGGQSVVDFSLPVGQQQQTVTVQGEASQVETTNATVGALTDQRQMRELPLNGRNFEQLILLAPGVQTVTSFNAIGQQGRAPSYSVAGARPEGQAILLDDENLQTFWNKGMSSIMGTSLGVEGIAEFQTLTNTFSAQFGGNGAVVNAVSRSGSNSFHGSAFEFLRNSALDARKYFDGASLPVFRRNQFGGSLGGPVKTNRAFFFGNYEGIRQLQGVTKIATVPDGTHRTPTFARATNPATYDALVSTVALYPMPTTFIGGGLGQVATVGNQVGNEDYVLGRLDYSVSEKDSLFVRYISDKAFFLEPYGGGAGTGNGDLALWSERDRSRNQFITVEERRIISPTLVNVARVSFSRPVSSGFVSEQHSALQYFAGAGKQDGSVTITGLSGLGGSIITPFVMNQNRFTEADDLLWTKGSHSMRFGVQVVRLQSNTDNPKRESPAWAFQGLASFLAGTAQTVQGVPLSPTNYSPRDYRQTQISPYFQDDWKVISKLTLNLGLRWDYVTNPTDSHNQLYGFRNFATSTGYEPIPNVFLNNPSGRNFNPRFGFAYDPFADHKTSIRGGFGIFQDIIMPPNYQSGFGQAKPWENQQQVNPVYPFAFASISPSLPSVSSAGWSGQQNATPYMMQYNLNIQRQLAQSTILSVGYVGSRGLHLMTAADGNPPIPVITANGGYQFASLVAGRITQFGRVNKNLGVFLDMSPVASSQYHSLQASLNRRLVRNIQAQASYTYSKCIDDGSFGLTSFNSNTSGSVTNPYQRFTDRSVCSFDITETLRVNSIVTLPFRGNRVVEGWQVSGIFSAQTGVSYNISTGFDQAGLVGTGTVRPNYIAGCNSKTGLVDKWFDPACFSPAGVGLLGNVGRLSERGPGFVNTDLALLKDTRLRRISENFAIQFRAEFFNIFNHTNFGLPRATLFSQGTNGAGVPVSSAGRITSTIGNARQIQFGLKLVF